MISSASSRPQSLVPVSPATIKPQEDRPRVTILTGAASGIGLSLAHHLLISGDYKLILVDISPSGPELAKSLAEQYDEAPTPIFIQADVGVWDDQAALFKKAFDIGKGSIDILLANAGVADSDTLLPSESVSNVELGAEQEEPTIPDLKVLDVDLRGVMYGIKLFSHYARLSRYPASSTPRKIIVTSSIFGLYPLPAQPLYSAAKHALIGLVRSMAPRLLRYESIALNCVCPSFVATGLAPEGMVEAIRKCHPAALTEMGVVMRAFDRFLNDRGVLPSIASRKPDVKSSSEGTALAEDATKTEMIPKSRIVLSGVVCEVGGHKLYDRMPVEYANTATKWLAQDPQGLWTRAYAGSSAPLDVKR